MDHTETSLMPVQNRYALRKNLKIDTNRLRQQEAIAWFSEYAIARRTLDELFDQAVNLVARILGVEMSKVLELLPEGTQLLVRAGVGWKDGVVGTTCVDVDSHTQAGYTLQTESTVITRDLSIEQRFRGHPILHEHGVVSSMTVVIEGVDRPFGVLGAHTRRLRRFTTQDARFLKSIANILASVIERVRVEQELAHSRDELNIILNGITEGITAQNPSGNVIYANETAAEMLGFSSVEELLTFPPDQLLSRFEILNEDGSPFPMDDLPSRRVLRGESGSPVRLRFRVGKTGQEYWSVASARAVLSPDGIPNLAVNIFRDISETVRRDHAQKLLAETGRLVSSSLEYQTTLQNIADLAAKHLADWCTVHITTSENNIQQVAVAHKDPSRLALAEDLQRRYPPDSETDSSLNRVLRTGQPEYLPQITDEMLAGLARDAEHLEGIRKLGLRSAMVVPLIARGRTLGALTLIWAESGRSYTQDDVVLARSLADRFALAIDNARLFEEAQALNSELEARVARRTYQLEKSHQRLVQEVEERRRIESALLKSEDLLTSLFESSPDATLLIDATGTIVRANRQAETFFGYERGELAGSQYENLLPPHLRARHAGNLEMYIANQEIRPMDAGIDLYAVRKDGTETAVDIMLSPVRIGDEAMVISAIRDISTQKKLQVELAETHRRLYESQEAERLSLSQELHDGPMQELYTVVFNLGAVKENLGTHESLEKMQIVKDSVQGVIHTLRNISGELRPPALTHFGLEKGIRSHLEKFIRSNPDIKIEANLASDRLKLPERTRLALYRVYQNSLSNILRHAQARTVTIDFQLDDKSALLRITDDGKGFEVPGRWVELARAGHFGLVSMAERINSIGGTLEVNSAPGKGTTIQVVVPLTGPGG